MMNRRDFIQACTVILGGSVLQVGCGQGGGGSEAEAVSSLPVLNRSDFEEIPSTIFSVSHDTFGAIDMTLVAIEDELAIPEAEQFSLLLSGPGQPLFDEANYDVYNASLGQVQLYLQPGDSPAGEQRYRAIFSILDA